MNLVKEVVETALDLRERLEKVDFDLTDGDILSLAVMIEGHRLYAEANVLRNPQSAPTALEAISMAIKEITYSQTTT